MKHITLLAAVFFAIAASAEYRVFLLRISKKNSDPNQPRIERTVQSTLDPIQYRDLYPVQTDETIEYTDTWMCFGRTEEFKDFCPNPKKAQIPEENVSNPTSP